MVSISTCLELSKMLVRSSAVLRVLPFDSARYVRSGLTARGQESLGVFTYSI